MTDDIVAAKEFLKDGETVEEVMDHGETVRVRFSSGGINGIHTLVQDHATIVVGVDFEEKVVTFGSLRNHYPDNWGGEA